ncbi:MAG: aconitate hydratase AcnA [Micromonosporaceae bacterium]|nr:aconitate hydratase AcnA [Micromonosporaceae bacterium]
MLVGGPRTANSPVPRVLAIYRWPGHVSPRGYALASINKTDVRFSWNGGPAPRGTDRQPTTRRPDVNSLNTFGARSGLSIGTADVEIFRLDAVDGADRLPLSLKILLENLLRTEDGSTVTQRHIQALGSWDPVAEPSVEIQFTPARVLMQDFTGVPCIVDLATMREAVRDLGGNPAAVNPLAPAELVIDHSVIADFSGTPEAFDRNVALEYERNQERYQFLRWGQTAFDRLAVVPPGTGIVHQVNVEHLARIVVGPQPATGGATALAYPDTVVGTDSHTTMVNGLGVLGWGVGGIEAEAAMLGQPVSMLIPRVVGVRLAGELQPGATATDLVLTITELLRRHNVVGSFVEFHGPGVATIPLATRATIGNMAPEYGSTVALFGIDAKTLRYAKMTGRSGEHLALIEAYAKEQGLWHDPAQPPPAYSANLELDLSTVEPSLAGPKRPQDRVALAGARESFREALPAYVPAGRDTARPEPVTLAGGTRVALDHGAVVLAAITSCTNTSNPQVMLGAAILARNAIRRGLATKPWVKATLSPGSRVVMDYYERAGLRPYLEQLGFHLVGYGCMTCIGNSGPLLAPVSAAIAEQRLAVVSVLSGNRNFEGRINPDVALNYLASPPLVVAYALAGTMDIDLTTEPLGTGSDGRPVFLADLWPSPAEIAEVEAEVLGSDLFTSAYADVFSGDERWRSLPTPSGDTFAWNPGSTYIRKPPYFEGMPRIPGPVTDLAGGRVLASLGDSVTTDHISPAGAIREDSPAGRYLTAQGVAPAAFNSYGSRRGNHEVMVRGTFANLRLRNQLVPGTEGGFTVNHLTGERTTIYDAAVAYAEAGIPLLILAGKEYGSGSSRDWAAKGTALLGVRAVLAESFERIHRSNLIGMGVLPLEYLPGDSAARLGLTGTETFTISGISALTTGGLPRTVRVTTGGGVSFDALVRIDTPTEAEYYRNGGILPYVLRRALAAECLDEPV